MPHSFDRECFCSECRLFASRNRKEEPLNGRVFRDNPGDLLEDLPWLKTELEPTVLVRSGRREEVEEREEISDLEIRGLVASILISPDGELLLTEEEEMEINFLENTEARSHD